MLKIDIDFRSILSENNADTFVLGFKCSKFLERSHSINVCRYLFNEWIVNTEKN